jgi:ArsR family transcriptional regulator
MSNQAVLPAVGTDPGQRVCCTPLTRAPLGETEAAELTHVLKAVADPVRLRLLSLIGAHDGGEACVCDLTAAFDLTGPTISHHLKVLREAGLIESDRRGTWVYYRIVPARLASLARAFSPDGNHGR